ncbi:hypothetical protein HDK64DRAFT_260981 [Phyllosticta capitalensis]
MASRSSALAVVFLWNALRRIGPATYTVRCHAVCSGGMTVTTDPLRSRIDVADTLLERDDCAARRLALLRDECEARARGAGARGF